MKNKSLIVFIGVIFCLLVFAGISLTSNIGKTSSEITKEQSVENLDKILKEVKVSELQPRKGNVSLTSDVSEELPNISKYPLSVEGNGDINLEIFATSEKSGKGKDGWLNEIAQDFNDQQNQISGQTVSISIRPIASGLGTDYISSGKYFPDAFSPSNEFWGKIIEANGKEIKLAQKRLIGNVAGILLSKSKNDELKSKYGEVTIKTITEATANNEISMGYTNPFASATGLNFLTSTLNAYDASNPLSEQSILGFENFQKNVPFVSYTTLQMNEAADSGVLDAFIMEYQTYINNKDLNKYVFIPFGVRHDNPVYSIGDLSKEKSDGLQLFLEYCATKEAQDLATQYGFNNLDTYKGENYDFSGETILEAQDIYKDKKNSGKPVTAVFVADISGSMSGEPINNLKKSLSNGAQYIGADNSIGLVSYNNDVYINLPINKFDLNQRSLFTGAIEDLDASGNTASFDAVSVALKMLLDAKEANPDTKLILFLLSDGQTNQGHSLNEVSKIVKGLGIPVYTIGYNADLSELQELSNINEAASINADSEDVVYKIKSLFNSEM